MIDRLIHFFEQYVLLEPHERLAITNEIPILTVEKNHVLLQEGEVSQAFYFIIRGGVRLFYQVGLEEKTAYFYLENTFVSSYESFTKQTPAKHNLQTIEDATLAVISTASTQKLLALSPKFDFLARIIMEEELIVCQDIISSFVTQSNEERYLKLLDTSPELLQRIPQHQLATYLGVTPETLSRIRKRIAGKKLS